MADTLHRRDFLKHSAAASAALGLSIEERVLASRAAGTPPITDRPITEQVLPTGKIKDVEITRMFCGGNLTSGFAHSRDLVYVSSLLRNYFTDEKILETWQNCEDSGINTVLLRLDNSVIRLINQYWRERGGSLQWIAQIKPKEKDLTTDVKRAVDNGAAGVYVQGSVADRFVRAGRINLVAETLEFMKSQGVIAGIGAHCLEVVMASEEAGLAPDFYMKTLHSDDYFSATPRQNREDFMLPPHDNMWCTKPEQTIAYMKRVKRPWIAFKVLAAGAIHPQKGFQYAFENGADFVCVGMFDFQVREDVVIARRILSGNLRRNRTWMA